MACVEETGLATCVGDNGSPLLAKVIDRLKEAGLATCVMNSVSSFFGKLSSRRMLRAIEAASTPTVPRGRISCV
jgi:hypothetical protein